MFHHVSHAVRWSALFRDEEEAARLWSLLTGACPGLVACCVMPDHLHLIHPRDQTAQLAAFRRAFARFRNRRRGTEGAAVWAPLEPPRKIARGKERVQIRYVHLNPCRGELVRDPLAWPLSTHRDAVGLALRPVRRTERDPLRFHAYVSGDPSVDPGGTELPFPTSATLAPERVADVVAGLLRVPRQVLERRGPARSLWVGSCRALCGESGAALARLAGLSRRSVVRGPGPLDPAVQRVCSLAHDPRFGSLEALVRLSKR